MPELGGRQIGVLLACPGCRDRAHPPKCPKQRASSMSRDQQELLREYCDKLRSALRLVMASPES